MTTLTLPAALVPGAVRTVATYAAMTAQHRSTLSDGCLIQIADADGFGVFEWDADAADAADSITIFAHDTGGAGRFKRKYKGAVRSAWSAPTAAGVVAALGAFSAVLVSAAISNTSAAITNPFGKMIEFEPGAGITSSGAGSFTNNGTLLRKHYNPGALAWADAGANGKHNFEGLSVEVGNFGSRSFGGTIGLVHAIAGAVSIPATAAHPAHASGLAGHAKTLSTTTAAVGIFGEGDAAAAGVLVWGGNVVGNDRGYAATAIWGFEIDVNQTHASTAQAFGLYIAGGSTQTPTIAQAIRIMPFGVFASPAKRWTQGIAFVDGACDVAIEVGSRLETNSGSQPINCYYRNGSNTPTHGAQYVVDPSGSLLINLVQSAAVIRIGVSNGAGGYYNNVVCLNDKVGIGIFSPSYRLHVDGAFVFKPGTNVVPLVNGDVAFDTPNNTTFRVKHKGTDGTERQGTLTLS